MALHFEDTFTVWNAYGKDCVCDITKTSTGNECVQVSVTSSSKDSKTKQIRTDWKGIIKFYGSVAEKVKSLNLVEKDRIKVKGTEQNMGQDGKLSKYPNFTGWEVDKAVVEKTKEVPKAPELVDDLQPLDISEDTLPF